MELHFVFWGNSLENERRNSGEKKERKEEKKTDTTTKHRGACVLIYNFFLCDCYKRLEAGIIINNISSSRRKKQEIYLTKKILGFFSK